MLINVAYGIQAKLLQSHLIVTSYFHGTRSIIILISRMILPHFYTMAPSVVSARIPTPCDLKSMIHKQTSDTGMYEEPKVPHFG